MPTVAATTCYEIIRRKWEIRGQVQGVGFRPFVYRLAMRHHLSGFVRNDSQGVTIEAQGRVDGVELFAQDLITHHPSLARFEAVNTHEIPLDGGGDRFVIFDSLGGTDTAVTTTSVTVDTVTCAECLTELLGPTDRRFRHGLINCTNCGPRYSIIRRVPYDRPNTTMASFPMCVACEREYRDVDNRRFHAQPIACHDCGARVDLVDVRGRTISNGEPIREAAARLQRGQIVAVKGIGGFHLATRADDDKAVARLRELKLRDAKPFAVMCATVDQARRLVHLGDQASEAMASEAGPIVLAERRSEASIARRVAPGNHRLGVMLPATPIHHLLFASQQSGFGPLVMTSANTTDDPLVIDNQEAVDRLAGVCDAILWHDRMIARPVDDSVLIDMGQREPLPIRRSRGYVPSTLKMPIVAGSDGLCVGGQLKCTITVVRDGLAVLSQHLGNLEHPLAFSNFQKTVGDLCDLLGTEPQWIAHDLHPAYLSTGYARQLAACRHIPLIGVQHHHAHAASLMAEHGRTEPMLAVVCDGVGYGDDAASWGGELLLADLAGFRRLARLRPMVLAGGDAAAKDIRRCGMALLYQAVGENFDHHPAAYRLVSDPGERRMLASMIKRGVCCVPSSSAGRLFDGVAALLGVCDHNSFESQAAMALESGASQVETEPRGDVSLFIIRDANTAQGVQEIDLSPLILQLLAWQGQGRPSAISAWVFHDQLAWAWEALVTAAAHRTGVRCVGLSGGVFCNELLTEILSRRLTRRGLRVLHHRVVPPNDGGLSLGQAAVAVARMHGTLKTPSIHAISDRVPERVVTQPEA